MEKINRLIKWFDENQNLAYAIIRFFLGVALFVRGWIFFADPGAVTEMAREESLFMWFSYVTFGHLIGGFLLIIGLLTRLASLIQIPILIGAVFIVNAGQHLASINQSLELAVMVLVLLIVYFFFGSGKFSFDQYFAEKKVAVKDSF